MEIQSLTVSERIILAEALWDSVIAEDVEIDLTGPQLAELNRRLAAFEIDQESRKLEYVNLATSLDDLKVPPGNKLHRLSDDREGQHAIAVNDQWRICFRFEDGDAFDVEVCDYH
jgi:proteic killer suppression protein